MSTATTGHARVANSDTTQASPRFALPLKDEAAELEESALLKVFAQLQYWLSLFLRVALTMAISSCGQRSMPCLQVIESEYTAKYLESLGACPSQAAQDLVRKVLPLTADCLQTKLKVRSTRGFGWVL